MTALQARFVFTQPPIDGPPSTDALRRGIAEAEGVLCTLTDPIDAAMLGTARRLKIIANCAVGYNNIATDAAKKGGIVVTNTPDILTDTTADLTWALLLAAARRIPEGHQLAQSGQWTGWGPTQLLGVDVAGKTLGIIGMGRIGQAVARRAGGFQMPILYYNRTARTDAPAGWRAASLEDVLAGSDFVTIHVPLTAETRHVIGARELQRMKPTAYLINTARGPVVDERALVEALRSGRLAGAGLDVYEREPEIHPGLLGCPSVVTLPHVGSATLATRVAMGMACVENLTAVLIEKREPPNRVA